VKREHFRVYRALRAGLGIARVMPRYAWLVLRDRYTRQGASETAWDQAHARAANELQAIALALAGVFTKVAQIVGARADVFPAAFLDALGQFHDSVPARPLDALRATVEKDLGGPLDAVFRHIEPVALGAASLAQVHRATLHDGSDVVVKIQYPEIRRIMPLDMKIVRLVGHLASWLQRRIDVRSLAEEVTRFIELELDFRREVVAMQRLREILATHADVDMPVVHPALCGENVIVMQRLEGIQVARKTEFTAAGHAAADVARKIGDLYGKMIFESGFFHGDPHPGNLLVLADGRIGLLDFGLCKELPKQFARDTAQMIVSGLIGDTESALAAAHRLGFEVQSIRGEHLRAIFLMAIGDSDGDDSFLEILNATRIRKIPEDFALVARTLVLLNGLSHRLAPGRRLIQAELLKHLANGAAQA
jgi:ubiquinone biosynthesis protein